jgi:PAS domain-containing protein
MAKAGQGESVGGGGEAAPAPEPATAVWDFQAVLAIADALPMPLAYVDAGLAYRFCNRSFADFLELPRSALIGRTVAEVLSPEGLCARRPMLDAALAG